MNNSFRILSLLALTWVLCVLPLTKSEPKKGRVPPNPTPTLQCARCEHCEAPPPESRWIKRTDKSNRSYCYTKQFNDRGMVVIERGAIRPKPEDFHDNFHKKCPDSNHVTRSKSATWCFCAESGCNTERMWIDGVVISSDPKPYKRPPQDTMGETAAALE